MRLAALTVVAILWLGPTLLWASDARALIGRLALIPDAPGGSAVSPPVYEADAVPAATFFVHLSADIQGTDVETYLADRVRLIAARYAVWLYRFDEEVQEGNPALPAPTLVINPDASGAFPFTAPALAPGRTYAWQVVATVQGESSGTVTLWSTPLFFRTAPAESSLPGLLTTDAHRLAATLLGLVSRQQRSEAALSTALRGLRLLSNYPTASDTFLSAPLTEDGRCPRPDWLADSWLNVSRLMMLGNVAGRAAALQQRLRAGEDVLGEVSELGSDLYDLLQRWSENGGLPETGAVATMVVLADRLRRNEPRLGRDDALSALSELLLAADEVVGTGTADLQPTYVEAFVSYARATDQRIREVAEIEHQLELVLGVDETEMWMEHLHAQRAELALLVDELERGRLNKALLLERVAIVRAEHQLAGPADYAYVDARSCEVRMEKIKRLTPENEPQVAALGAEVVGCLLRRLAASLWPSPE